MILSRTEKKEKLNTFIKEIKDTVIVEIHPMLGMDTVIVHNTNLEWATMSYRKDKGFYISTTGAWVNHKDAELFGNKLIKLASIAKTLNALYVPEK